MRNEYDDLVEDTFGSSQLNQPSSYDQEIDEVFMPNKQQFVGSQNVAKDIEPTRANEALKIAKEQNVPVHFVEQNLDAFKKHSQKTTDYDSLVAEAPRTAKFLEDPYKAAAVKNDIETLAKTEKNLKRIKAYKDEPGYVSDLYKAGRVGTDNLASSSLHLAVAFGVADVDDVADNIAALNKKVQKAQQQAPAYAKEFNQAMQKEGKDVDRAAAYFSSSFKQFKERKILEGLKRFTVGGLATVGETVDQIGSAVARPKGALRATTESLAFSAPALATGAVTGKLGAMGGGAVGTFVMPGPGTAVGATVGGIGGFATGTFAGSAAVEFGAWVNQALAERGYNLSDANDIRRAYSNKKLMAEIRGEALRKGVTTAGVDALFTVVGGKFVAGAKGTKRIAKIKAAVKDVGVQAVGEGASEFAGQVAARKGDVSKVSIGEAITEGVVSMGQSVGTTAIGASYRKVLSKDVVTAAEEVAESTAQAQDSLSELQALEQTEAIIAQSELLESNPELLQEFIEQNNLDEGQQAVYFQSDEWDQFWRDRGESPVAKAEELLGSGDAYQDSKTTGQAISIPLAPFMTQYAGKPEFQEILAITRTQPAGLTVDESRQVLQNLPQTVQEIAQEAQARLEFEEQIDESMKSIKDNVEGQLRAIGRDPIEAVPLLEFYRTMAIKEGLNPQEIADKYKVEITGPADPANVVKTFDQKGKMVPTPNELGYYSAVQTEVEAMEFKQMPAKDLLGRIRNLPGIKKEELEWTGIEEFLEAADGKLSKEEVMQYLQNNVVEVTQVVRGENFIGEDDGDVNEGIKWEEERYQTLDEIDPYGDLLHSNFSDDTYEGYAGNTTEDLKEKYPDRFEAGEFEEAKTDKKSPRGDVGFVYDYDKLPDDVRDDLEEQWTKYQAEDIENGDSPYSQISLEAENYDIKIEGSDDYSYTVYYDGDVVANDVWNLDEAKMQAYQHLIESGDLDTTIRPIKENQFGWSDVEQKKIVPTKQQKQDHWQKNKERFTKLAEQEYVKDEGETDAEVLHYTKSSARWKSDKEITAQMNARHLSNVEAEAQVNHPNIQATLKGSGDKGYQLLFDAQGGDKYSTTIQAAHIDEAMEKAKQYMKDKELVLEEDQEVKTNLNDPTDSERHKQYSVDGGHNYREFLLRLPKIPGNFVVNTHFNEANIISHVRTKDRITPDGKKVLFIEEVQSDWHQRGRDSGYSSKELELRRDLLEKQFLEADEQARVDDVAAEKFKHDLAVSLRTPENIKRISDQFEKFYDAAEKDGDPDDSKASFEQSVNIEGVLVEDFVIWYEKDAGSRTYSAGGEFRSRDETKEQFFESLAIEFMDDYYQALATEEQRAEIRQLDAKEKASREKRASLQDQITNIENAVPDAPFKATDAWIKLAMKRMLSLAAQEDYDFVSWTPGEVHAERWNYGDKISEIHSKKDPNSDRYNVVLLDKDGDPIEDERVSRVYDVSELNDTFGKGVADKIRAQDNIQESDGAHVVTNADIRIGAEGIVNTYDKFIPKIFKDLLKKLDKQVKIGVQDSDKFFGETLTDGSTEFPKVLAFPVTDKMKAGAKGGFTLFQDEKPGDTPKRGAINITGNGEFNIQMLEGADKSTFFHETGHYFLEVFKDMAGTESSSQELKDDFQSVLDWLGVESADQIETEHHEKWARGFEAYLREGNAPSSKLRRAFNTFKVWLTKVYRSVLQLDVKLTDDVRDVMDRMLASEDEIAEARQKTGDFPAFDDPIAAGMTASQAEEYRKLSGDSEMLAKEGMMKKLMRAQVRKAKIDRAKIKKETTDEINSVRVYNTIAILKRGKMADGSAMPEGSFAVKLDPQEFGERYPQFIRNENFKGTFGKKPVSLEIAASLLGYDSVDIMVHEIANAPVKKDYIDFVTNQKVQQISQDLLNMEEISKEAEQLVHNESRAKRLRMEYEFLASNSPRLIKDITRRVVKRPLPDKEVKRYAKKTIDNLQVGMVKPNTYRLAERRAAKEAGEALARQDIQGAFEAKQRELINHELYRAAVEVKEKVAKDNNLIKKVFQKDDKLAKTRDMDLIGAARAILSRHGLGNSKKDPLQHIAKIKEYDPDSYEMISGIISGVMDNPGLYTEIPYGQYKDMMDTVKALWDLSKEAKEIEVGGKRIAVAKANEDLIEAMQKFRKPDNKKKYNETATKWDKFKEGLLGVKAMVRRFEHWVDVMDLGDVTGPFRNFLFRETSAASDRFLEERKKYKEKFVNLSKGVREGMNLRQEIISDELNFKFKNKSEVLGALLHTGNESNLRKLLLGRGWATIDEDGNMNTKAWDTFVQRMWDEGILTKSDYDYVQSLWDLMEEVKPMAQRAHKKIFGFYFDEITAQEFETPFGTYKGGYAPAAIDPSEVRDIALKQQLEEFIKGHQSYTYPASGGRGFTMSRVEFNKPLSIDLSLVPKHIEGVLRFSIIKPAVVDAAKVAMSQDFKEAMGQVDPVVVDELIKPALNRADKNTMQTTSTSKGGRVIQQVSGALTTNASLQLMFANVINTVEQFGGLGISATLVKPKYLARSMYKYMLNPVNVAKDIRDSSTAMRTRTDDQIFEMERQSVKIFEEQSNLQTMRDFAKRHAFFLQAFTQNIIDNITWQASYDQSVTEGLFHDDAVRKADSIVRTTQSSRRPIDISNMETNATLRFFQMFMNFFNMMANINASNFTKLYYEDIGMKKKFAKGLYLYSMGFATVAVVSAGLRKAASGGLDEDEDGEYTDDLYDVFIGSQIDLALAMIPVGGQAVNAGLNQANDKFYDDRVSASPAVSAVTSVVGTVTKAATGKLDPKKKGDVRDGLTALGTVTGLPLRPVSKPVTYGMDVQSGKAKPKGPVDVIRGVVTGKPGVR